MGICLSHDSAFRFWNAVVDDVERASLLRYVGAAAADVSFIGAANRDICRVLDQIPETASLPRPIHILVANSDRRYDGARAVRHEFSRAFKQYDLFRIHPVWENVDREVPRWLDGPDDVYAVSPEHCALQLADTLAFPMLVRALFDLCGSYGRASHDPTLLRKRPAPTTAGSLRRFAGNHHEAHGSRALLEAASLILDGSASPAESALTAILTLPYNRGGFGLDAPQLNHRISVPGWARSLAGVDNYFIDLYWPSLKLAVEYDSDEWHYKKNRKSADSVRRSVLASFGIETITVESEQLNDEEGVRMVARDVANRMGKRIRPRSADFPELHGALRKVLLAPYA